MTDNVKRQFDKAEPSSYRDHGGDGEMFRKIQDVGTWARVERQAVAKQVAQNREAWLNEERQKETEARQAPTLELEPPIEKRSVEQVARERVSLKIQGFMAEVEAERARRIEAITGLTHATHVQKAEQRTVSPQLRTSTYQRDANAVAIQSRAIKVRAKARVHFNRMFPLFVSDAEASGSNTPVKDVYDNYQKRMARIDRAENNLLGQTLKRSLRQEFSNRKQCGPAAT